MGTTETIITALTVIIITITSITSVKAREIRMYLMRYTVNILMQELLQKRTERQS